MTLSLPSDFLANSEVLELVKNALLQIHGLEIDISTHIIELTSKLEALQTSERLTMHSEGKSELARMILEIDHLIGILFDLTRPLQALQAVRYQRGEYWERRKKILAIKRASTEHPSSERVTSALQSALPSHRREIDTENELSQLPETLESGDTSIPELSPSSNTTASQPPVIRPTPRPSIPLAPRFKPSTHSDDNTVLGFMNVLQKCTVASVSTRPFVLVSKLTEWFRSTVQHGNRKITQAERLLASTYAYQGQPRVRDIDGCFLIFSILLELGHGELVIKFLSLDKADKHLPVDLYSLRSICRQMRLADAEKVAMHFHQLQWKYCPARLDLHMGREYSQIKIMPFSRKVRIDNDGGIASLWEVEVPEEFLGHSLREAVKSSRYNRTDDELGPRYHFALKVFEEDERDLFNAERDAFVALREQGGMITCLGEYTHRERSEQSKRRPESLKSSLDDKSDGVHQEFKTTYNLILETAELDLYEFFLNKNPPVLRSEVDAFWKRLFDVARAVRSIHNLSRPYQQGLHGNIMLDNILLIDGKFKLADLGFTKFARPGTEQLGVFRGGAESYGAPECYRQRSLSKSKISRNIDIWSLGCVFSVAATWIVLGSQGISQFRALRAQEIGGRVNLQQLLGTTSKDQVRIDIDDFFHDGSKVLPGVLSWHIFLRTALRTSDQVTSRVLDLVDRRMLVNSIPRFDADGICLGLDAIQRQVLAVRRNQEIPQDILSILQTEDDNPPGILRSSLSTISTATSSAPASIADEPSSAALPERLSKESLRSSALEAVEHPSRVLQRTSSPLRPRIPPTIPGFAQPDSMHQNVFQAREELEKLQKGQILGRMRKDETLSRYIHNFDIIFLVDNSETMIPYWYEATYLLETLLFKLRGLEGNGIDLQFGSSHLKIEGSKHSRFFQGFKDIVAAMGSSVAKPKIGNGSNLLFRLLAIVNAHLRLIRREGGQPLLLYVLTDGIWQDESQRDVVAGNLRETLIRLGHDGPSVAIQFIRFGDDPVAIDRLNRLDDGRFRFVDVNVCSIDVEPARGNVYKMLLGTITKKFDVERYEDYGLQTGVPFLDQSFNSYAMASGSGGPPQTRPGSSGTSSSVPSTFATSIFSETSGSSIFRPESPPSDSDELASHPGQRISRAVPEIGSGVPKPPHELENLHRKSRSTKK
ncbi:uncharacterized protein LY89DRAFT_41524 [Mollisia scopiformis]|uniref:Protein kinase domain-containing protein n=1 Tax=Mollisia scopiformis TaxID=149040 RepID=A0A194XDF8_MOLSC|nr:uncharacterized protein LY89DRAFT_41524 [Mollisia scopiformis]KUJ18189.1 hypothetical protein LY89DRAFT_41524 [Mollisia scopiformis]